MRAFIKITVSIAILISLGFTYMSAKQAKTVAKTFNDGNTQETAINGDEIALKTHNLLGKELLKPYNLKTDKEPEKVMFSRCPSGNRAIVGKYASTKEDYSYGEMRYYKGCKSNKVICDFRVRISDNSVDVLQSDSVSYIAANLWIENATVTETNDLNKELAEN